MYNMSNVMTNNYMHFDTCHDHLDPLFDITTSTSIVTLQSDYCLQTISFIIASIIGLFSMSYRIISRFIDQYRGYRLHLVGIGRTPKGFHKSPYKLLPNIDTQSTMITIQTPLKPDDTIYTLKQYIKKLYSITNNDILILYSHHIISNDEQRTLTQCGITNNSLLTIAICNTDKVIIPSQIQQQPLIQNETAQETIEYESESESEDNSDAINAMFSMYIDYESETEPVEDVNELFGMFQHEYDDELVKEATPITWPRLGFDIITQQHDVLVHKMPKCGHEMNAQSLYQYALNTLTDSNNVYLPCPHNAEYPKHNELCDTKWQYLDILDILKSVKHNNNDLELLSSRNFIENECNVQKCPRCDTLYYKNYNESDKALQDIKTVKDIEKEFKFKCVLCPEEVIEVDVKIETETEDKEEEEEEEEEEDIDGDAVNAMFGTYDSDSDSFDSDSDDNEESLIAIEHMFDDYDDYKVMYESLNEFCFCCGSEWNCCHICSSSFKSDLVCILSLAETKKIGCVSDVPSIRCCPNCSQLIFHVDACKHMKCRECKTDFCFVCLKRKKDGNWQCGSHSDKCVVAARQNKDTLPNTIVITKQSFKLF